MVALFCAAYIEDNTLKSPLYVQWLVITDNEESFAIAFRAPYHQRIGNRLNSRVEVVAYSGFGGRSPEVRSRLAHIEMPNLTSPSIVSS